jgi:branched-subunit amino acid permease
LRNFVQLVLVLGLVGFALYVGWGNVIAPALDWLFQAPH